MYHQEACLFALLVSALSALGLQYRMLIGSRRSSHENLVFSGNFLWVAKTKSKLLCANFCVEDIRCTTFTYTSQDMTCRGHSSITLDAADGTTTPNTTMFDIKDVFWLEKACTVKSDCRGPPLAVCFVGRCVCSPGYYYSFHLNDCVDGCLESDLRQEMLEYPGWYVLNLNMNTTSTLSWSACQNWCRQVPQCRTFEYNFNITRCSLANITALDAMDSWIPATSNTLVSYYQKACW